MSPQIIFLLLIATGALLEVAGDVTLKYWALSHRTALMIFGLGIYFAGSIFWAYSLWYESLSKAIIVFTLSNLLIALAVALLVFDETLTHKQMVGVGLALVAIFLIEF